MIGKTISHYKILEKLGAGGMGVVYKAEDTHLKRTVALKFLPPELTREAAARKRFVHEAQAASALEHPNICTVFEVDESDDGQAFIAMSYCEGETLKQKIEKDSLDFNETIDYILQCAAALQKAHRQGIVHRDIKPANVMITDEGQVKILDFGLAKLAGQSRTTAAHTAVGTIAYMSPEQVRGEGVDHRADIWSLGVMLYEILTSQLPFRGDHEQAIIYSILNEDPIPLTDINSDLPAELMQIIDKMLEKNPHKRYREMSDVVDDLLSLTGGASPPKRFSKRAGFVRAPIKPILASIFILAVLVIVSYFVFFQVEEKPIKSIAVLPLENLTGDPGQEYFCDGMTDALISELAQVRTFDRVISRTSIMTYKNQRKPLPVIAKELGVDAVVEGTVSLSGSRVKIDARLIEATEDRHLWAHNFESDLGDVLKLQSEIAQSVVREIRMKLSPEDSLRFAQRKQVEPEAYQYYLQGRYQSAKMTAEAMPKAIGNLEKAINIDSTFALAHAVLADIYIHRSIGIAPMQAREALQLARHWALKAIRFDKYLSEAHSALGYVYFSDWKWEAAEKEFRTAIELNPNSAIAHQRYFEYLLFVKNFDEAVAEINTALKLDPLSLFARTQEGWPYWFYGHYEKALQIWEEVLELEPDFALAQYNAGLAEIMLGHTEKAIAAFQRALALSPGTVGFESLLAYAWAAAGEKEKAMKTLDRFIARWEKSKDVAPYWIATIYGGLKQPDEVFRWLEIGFREHDVMLITLKVEQGLKEYRYDPRYVDLVKRMGL